MVAKRWIILVCAALLTAPALLNAATVRGPYEDQGYLGRNSLIDVSALGACVDGVGCRDIFHNLCPSDGPCNLERVPKGRCSRTDTSKAACLWPSGAGFCGFDGNIGCVTSADCPPFDTCNTGTNNPACACQGEDSSLANYETKICGDGGSGLGATVGVCSDGDDSGAYQTLPGDIGTGGGTIPLCTNIVVTADGLTNCGEEAGQNLKGAYGEKENPSLAPTPQRNPGSFGLNLSAGGAGSEILDLKTTYSFELTDDDPVAGVRRRTALGKSYFTDWVIGNQQFTDAPTSTNGPNTMYCDFATSLTGIPGEPFNANTAVPGSGVGTSCSISGAPNCATHQECIGADATAGTADDAADLCTGLTYCHSAPNVFNQSLFLFTTAAAAATGNCPPDCGTTFDFHSQEELELLRVTSLSREAGIQTALNNLGPPLAGPGDAVGVVAVISNTFVGVQDSRCFMGGSPGAPAGEVGRCSGTGTDTCNPANFAPGVDCPVGETCEYCFSSVNQAGLCAGNGAACNDSADCGGSGPCNLPADWVLPGGYDNDGLAALDLVSPPGVCASDLSTACHPDSGNGPGVSTADCGGGRCFVNPRIGIISERVPDVRTPLTLNLVTGNMATEVRDNDVKTTKDFTTMGETSGGSPGIGAGVTYTNGTSPLAAFPTYVMPLTITVQPEDPGVPVSKLMRTYDFGSGPDRIVGCIGDSSKSLGDGECNQRLGVIGNPGNTGTDDPILASSISGCSLTCIGAGNTVTGERGSACGPGSSFDGDGLVGNGEASGQACDTFPAGGADGSVCGCGGVIAANFRAEEIPDKDATYPTWLVMGGGTALDLDVLSSFDTDAIFKIAGTTCPVAGTCSAGSSNPGDQCVRDADCTGGTCENIDTRCADKCDALGGDPDGDGICDDGDGSAVAGDNPCTGGATTGCDDNCPLHANADQADTGGIQSPQYTPGNGAPDGIGNACQCGDMNGDGKVNSTDVVLYRRFFAGLVSPFSQDRCSVSPESPPACNSTDVTIMRRTFAGLTTGIIAQNCNAAKSTYVRR